MSDTPDPVRTGLVRLPGDLSCPQLLAWPPHELAPMLERIIARVDSPGTSISGYNGAGPLSGQDGTPDRAFTEGATYR